MPCGRHSDYIIQQDDHINIKAGKSPDDFVGKEAFRSCPLLNYRWVLCRVYWLLRHPNDSNVSRLSWRTSTPSRAMKRENFSPFKQVRERSIRTKTKTNSLYIHDISLVYEEVTRFRQQLLLTQNGMIFG